MNTKPAIMYRRVSTKKQGATGYGLDEQEEIIKSFCHANGFHIPTIGCSFTDVESGASWTREGLDSAIQRSQMLDCPIIVQSTDRIGRDVAMVSSVIKETRFIDAQLGMDAQPMFIQLKAIFAEEERNLARTRTRNALAAAKRRGVKLGNPNIDQARKKAEQARKAKADRLAIEVVVELLEMMKEHQLRRHAAGIIPSMGPSEFDPNVQVIVNTFHWMCQNGTFTKDDFCIRAKSRTGNGNQYNRRSLDHAINRVLTLLEAKDENIAHTLLSLTRNRAGFAGWDDASRANQELEVSGNYQSTLSTLISDIKSLL